MGPTIPDVRAFLLAVLLVLAGCASGPTTTPRSTAAPGAAAPTPRVLVFTRTTGFRHDSIPAAVAAVRDLGAAGGFALDATEDAAAFTAQNLARYRAVVFLLTTGDVLDDRQQGDVERYVRGGGGFLGVHSAADTEYGWPFYGELVGAYFRAHPAVQSARLVV